MRLCAWCGCREATEEVDGRETCRPCKAALEEKPVPANCGQCPDRDTCTAPLNAICPRVEAAERRSA